MAWPDHTSVKDLTGRVQERQVGRNIMLSLLTPNIERGIHSVDVGCAPLYQPQLAPLSGGRCTRFVLWLVGALGCPCLP
jgi:hypothetical protein